MAQYYCLISGFVEYGFDTERKALNYDDLMDEIFNSITKSDAEQLRLLMEFYDVQNLILKSFGRDNSLSRLGSYSEYEVTTFADLLTGKVKLDEELDEELNWKPFVKEAYQIITDVEYASERGITASKGVDNLLLTLYYDYVDKHGEDFVKKWMLFDRNIKNISAAVKARQILKDPSLVVIGDGEIVESILSNSSSDFGLKGELRYMDELLSILNNDNILKKERELDMLRWSEIDEMNTFSYFSMDVVLGYYLKIAMIDRWMSLDPSYGREIFNKLVGELSSAKININDED